MFDNIRELYTQVSSLDLTKDRAYYYERIAYLAVYQIIFNQITLINARSQHPVFLIIPLEVLNALNKWMLHKFSECNDKIARDIQQEHFDILQKLDQMNKAHSSSIENENDVILHHYVHQINNHVAKTRLIAESVSIVMMLVNILSVVFINPIQFVALLTFIDLVAKDMQDLVVIPHDEGNVAIKQEQENIDRVATEFNRNKNIIYECVEEGSYFTQMRNGIEQFYAIRKDNFFGYKINKAFTEFEYRYQQKMLLMTWIIPKNPLLTWIYADLKTYCSRLALTMISYHDVQAKLKKLQMERIHDLLKRPHSTPSAVAPMRIVHLKSGVLFKLEPFTYKIDDRRIFTIDRELRIPSCKWTTMMGVSGSGKTTLIGLCLKTVSDDSRCIYFLNRYRDYSYDDIRRHVSNIKPNADLFDASIRFNLLFGVKRPSEHHERLIGEYMEAFGLGYVVSKLDENIGQLSTGEKQRIKLIRCILHDRPIWVFDESTANLDRECELSVLRILRELQTKHGKSVIHITHNKELVRFSDCVISIQKKRVVVE